MSDRTWLDDMQTAAHNLRAHACTFRDLAARLRAAEMDRAAAIAAQSADFADEDSEALSHAIGVKVTADLHESREMTSVVFRAALAVAMLPADPAGRAK